MQTSTSWANKMYLFLGYIIVFGTTLFFSTATRSVFEVNKLGIIKISLSLMGMLYFYDRLIGKPTLFHPIKTNKWFNITLLLVWISHWLSTIFSKNIVISIFGSYDRWEGIITMSFYLFMVFLVANKTGLSNTKKMIWAIIIASGLSSLYGIVQSYGLDIISWSLDPSKRVFGSINNPVHYCAIMGMSVPVIIGQIFSTIEQKKSTTPITVKPWPFIGIIAYYAAIGLLSKFIAPSSNSIGWILWYVTLLGAPYLLYTYQYLKQLSSSTTTLHILFNSMALVIYATYLSYSRATWLGLTATIGLIFTITLITKLNQSKLEYSSIVIGCLTTTMTLYLIFLFNLHTTSHQLFTILAMLLLGSILMIALPFGRSGVISNSLPVALMLTSQFFQPSIASSACLFACVSMSFLRKRPSNITLPSTIIAFLLVFLNIQFIGMSAIHFINFVLLLLFLIVNEHTVSREAPLGNNPIFHWKLITIGLIALIIISPTIYSSFQSNEPTGEFTLISQANHKINSYQNIAIEGSARSSMWKSAIPWTLDHPILGTGLDTIKYYFPNYRRSEYGKLEGGHNFTPDRLHNEYLNTLATKGIVGFITYYILFVGTTIFSLLLFIKKTSSIHQFMIIGLMGGALVYLGQVLFNFGVVATLIYFFLFLGLSISIKTNHETH